jgi:CRP/FNR family transcriptional regulator, cyclic AMP receptor protein
MAMLHRPSIETLQRLPLFGGIPDDALAMFSETAEPVGFARGQAVFVEGDQAKSLFVVQDGSFEASKQAGSQHVHLMFFEPGDCFGEMSFLDMQPRSATVRAMEEATARYCGGDQKCTMLLVMNMARELSRRLRAADARLCSRAKTPLEALAAPLHR